MAETFTQEDPTKVKPGIVAGATEAPYSAPVTEPVTTEVAPEQETVEARLNKLTEGGSKYVNLARGGAQRATGKRGLINTSIAAGAGEEAAIKQALPIAQQDAETYRQTRFMNQEQRNQFLQNRQSADLNKEVAGFQSGLNLTEAEKASKLKMGEAVQQSALTNEENTLLNDLTMKRDEGLTDLTLQEQQSLSDLEMKRDAALSELKTGEMGVQSKLDIERDENAAKLNENMATWNNTLSMLSEENSLRLKTEMETILSNEKFSDQVKLDAVASINKITLATQQQITDIGLSDATADQQAAAIDMAEQNRDASIQVYTDLLESFSDWAWSTDFTQEAVTPVAPATTPTTTEPTGTVVSDTGGVTTVKAGDVTGNTGGYGYTINGTDYTDRGEVIPG